MTGTKIRYSRGENVFQVFNVILISVIIILTLYPVWHIVMGSFSQGNLYMAHRGILLFPLGAPTISSYLAVFENPNILTGYANTMIVVFVGVTLNIFMTSLGAFFLSRKNVMWRNLVMLLIIVTMNFNGGLIPFYLTVRSLGLDNSLLALILPVAINSTNLIILRTAFASVPDSLEESAKIDGATHWRVLFSIVFPLSLPTVAVMVLYYAVGHWNSWFNAMIFLRNRALYPLQLILREILILNDTNLMTIGAEASESAFARETIKNAIIVVATVPILALYPFLQRFFVKGVMIGSVKG